MLFSLFCYSVFFSFSHSFSAILVNKDDLKGSKENTPFCANESNGVSVVQQQMSVWIVNSSVSISMTFNTRGCRF